MTNLDFKTILYKTKGNKEKSATIAKLPFSLDGLNSEEVKVLSHISRAVDYMTPIYAKQQSEDIIPWVRILSAAQKFGVDKKTDAELNRYLTILNSTNAPWALTDGAAIEFSFSLEDLRGFGSQAFFNKIKEIEKAPPGRELYPKDIQDCDLEGIVDVNRVNSSVVRNPDGTFRVVLHENRFREELRPVIENLKLAGLTTTNPTLKAYIASTIDELSTGSVDAREKTNLAWLNLEGNVDFMIGTGVETYQDKFKGIRGFVQAGVWRINNVYREFCEKFSQMLPELEILAPWTHKGDVDLTKIPKLRFVDALNRAGDYNNFPVFTLAESLPNEEDFREKYGSVNIVFTNVNEINGLMPQAEYIRDEFMRYEDVRKHSPYMNHVMTLLTAAHEIGHASGRNTNGVDPKFSFGSEYSMLEEARADVFAIWSLPFLRKKGLITEEQLLAGYYSMLMETVTALRSAPLDHRGGRNMTFHYLMKHGAINEIEEDSRIKYVVNYETIHDTLSSLLGELGNMRATQDLNKWSRFKEAYLDPSKRQTMESRFSSAPEGKILSYPMILERSNDLEGAMIHHPGIRTRPSALEQFIRIR